MLSAQSLAATNTLLLEGLPNLLDQVLQQTDQTVTTDRPQSSLLDTFLNTRDLSASLALLIGNSPFEYSPNTHRSICQKLNASIARLDEVLNAQVNCILHHPKFQELESSWRGLEHLIERIPEGANVKIRLLNATWAELVRDQERAIEFDQSHLFRKVYSDEFGTPGGLPYGLLVGNYRVMHRRTEDHPTDDLLALQGIMGVAAASFAPFVTSIDPRLLQLDEFSELEMPIDISKTFDQIEYVKFRSLREQEDSRFLGLLLPQVVYRKPYLDPSYKSQRFPFREEINSSKDYLWGNPCFAFAGMVARTFAETGWLAQIRGCKPNVDGGGVLADLPAIGYQTGRAESLRSVTDVHLTDILEKKLSQMGLIPICHAPETEEAVIYTCTSLQKPKTYDTAVATTNAQYSAMLQHLLCVSRFAHYLKVMIRDRIGSFTSPSECETWLQGWLNGFCLSNEKASEELKAKYPLSEGKVVIDEPPGMPGKYRCSIFLKPHFQLEQLSIGIKLTTQLGSGATT